MALVSLPSRKAVIFELKVQTWRAPRACSRYRGSWKSVNRFKIIRRGQTHRHDNTMTVFMQCNVRGYQRFGGGYHFHLQVLSIFPAPWEFQISWYHSLRWLIKYGKQTKNIRPRRQWIPFVQSDDAYAERHYFYVQTFGTHIVVTVIKPAVKL